MTHSWRKEAEPFLDLQVLCRRGAAEHDFGKRDQQFEKVRLEWRDEGGGHHVAFQPRPL